MSVEELLEKYKGAYASDFEVPSGSGSKVSSDSEVSGDEEVETEEDESDAESNTSSSGIKLLSQGIKKISCKLFMFIFTHLFFRRGLLPPLFFLKTRLHDFFFLNFFVFQMCFSQIHQETVQKMKRVRKTKRRARKKKAKMTVEMRGWSSCLRRETTAHLHRAQGQRKRSATLLLLQRACSLKATRWLQQRSVLNIKKNILFLPKMSSVWAELI